MMGCGTYHSVSVERHGTVDPLYNEDILAKHSDIKLNLLL